MADVHFTRPNVGFGNILYVIAVTGMTHPLISISLACSRYVDSHSRFVGFIQTCS